MMTMTMVTVKQKNKQSYKIFIATQSQKMQRRWQWCAGHGCVKWWVFTCRWLSDIVGGQRNEMEPRQNQNLFLHFQKIFCKHV